MQALVAALLMAVVAAVPEEHETPRLSELQQFRRAFFRGDEEGTCPLGISVGWATELGSALIAPPLIADLFSDGVKDIVAPSFTHYIEAVDGRNGNDLHGWPYAHPSFRSQASPLQIDLEKDGTPELLIATYDGEIVFFRENGTLIPDRTLRLPKHAVPRRPAGFKPPVHTDPRHHGLDEHVLAKHAHVANKVRDTVNATQARDRLEKHENHPDIEAGNFSGHDQPPPVATTVDGHDHHTGTAHGHVAEPATHPGTPHPEPHAEPHLGLHDAHGDHGPPPTDHVAREVPHPRFAGHGSGTGRHVTQADHDDMEGYGLDHEQDYDGMLDEFNKGYGYGEYDYPAPEPDQLHRPIGTEAGLSEEAKRSLDLIFHPELFEAAKDVEEIGADATPFGSHRLGSAALQGDQVLLDAHILATPVLADLNFDGVLEVIVPVSYFLNEGDYMTAGNGLPDEVDSDHYVMGALVVLDLVTGAIRWKREFPLTTKNESFPGYMTATPVVANIDGDGVYDIIVTTCHGDVHAFDAHGNEKPGWPRAMTAPLLGPALTEDINGDGKMDVCAVDARGHVECRHFNGDLMWARSVDGGVADGLTAGDVNGDGWLDVTFATTTGFLWALDGRGGETLPGFPVVLGDDANHGPAVAAPVLLVNLNNTAPPVAPSASAGLHLVVPALDGVLYIVSGTTRCEERVDLGHRTYTMVLADDVIGNGKLDLVVTTLSGALIVLETASPFHPLQAWPSRVVGPNGMTAPQHHIGVAISAESRVSRDVRGAHFKMLFTITDERPAVRAHKALPFYYVTITVGKRLLIFARLLTQPREYSVVVPTPLERMYGTVTVAVRLPTGQVYEDSVALGFNMHFLETVKYLLLIPFLATCAALMLVKKQHGADDPPAYHDTTYDDDLVYVLHGPRSRRWAQAARGPGQPSV